MKIDSSTWIAACFECINIPVDDREQITLFVSKLTAVSSNIVRNPHDENP